MELLNKKITYYITEAICCISRGQVIIENKGEKGSGGKMHYLILFHSNAKAIKVVKQYVNSLTFCIYLQNSFPSRLY